MSTSTEGIGHRLRWARDQARLKQEALSGRVGISRPGLSRIESGRARPGLAETIALYEVLAEKLPGLSLEWLLVGRGEAMSAGTVWAGMDRSRRRFVLGLAALPMSVPLLDVERLGSPCPVDAAFLDGCDMLARTHADLRSMFPARELLPMVQSHLAGLESRAQEALPSHLRRRLLAVACDTAALAGWLCIMLARRSDARMHLERSEQMARENGDNDGLLTALHLQSDLVSGLCSAGSGLPAVARRRIDEAKALIGPGTPAALAAPLLLHSAEEHALAGEEDCAMRDLAAAEHVFGISDGCARLHATLDEATLTSYRGSCLQMLGQPAAAIEIMEPAIAPDRMPRARAAAMTELAAAHAQRGDLDHACHLLHGAVNIAAELGLTRHAGRVGRVRDRWLGRWDREAVVRDLDERLATIL